MRKKKSKFVLLGLIFSLLLVCFISVVSASDGELGLSQIGDDELSIGWFGDGENLFRPVFVYSEDFLAPNVTVIFPVNNSNLTGVVSFNVTATDAHSSVNACWYSLDNWSTNNSLSKGGGDSWFGSEASLSHGNYSARFACNDTFGNENASAFSSFHYDFTGSEVAAYLSGTRGNVSFMNTYIINATILTGRGEALLELWFNETLISNLTSEGNFTLQNITPTMNWDEAPYNFTAIYSGNANTSRATETWWVILPSLSIILPETDSVVSVNPFNLKLGGSILTPGNCTYNLSNAVSGENLGSKMFSFPSTTVQVPGSVSVNSELNVSVSCDYGYGKLARSVEFFFIPSDSNQWVGIFLILFMIIAGLCLLLGSHFDSVMFSFVGAIIFVLCGLYVVIYGLPIIASALFENVIGYSVLLLGAYLMVRVGLDFIGSFEKREEEEDEEFD